MIKIIATLVLICLLCGCTSWPTTAFDIANEPYHITDNNCVHKANKFVSLEGGIRWTVRVHGQGAHRMVFKDGWWVDPTKGTWVRELKSITPLWSWKESD